MSSFRSELIIDGQTYRLKNCSFEFVQNVGEDGRPNTTVMNGIVAFVLEEPAPKEILHWAAGSNEKKDGAVRFYEVNSSVGTHQLLEFKQAYCVHFCNTFDGEKHHAGALISSFIISAQILILDGVSVQNKPPHHVS